MSEQFEPTEMARPARRFRKHLTVGVCAGVLLVLALCAHAIHALFVEGRSKTELQRISSPDGRHEFVLLTDLAGFGDRAWYVYEIDRGHEPSRQLREGNNTEDVLFWNYTEDGRYSASPHLELRGDRYLVFSRGDRYHSLYDTVERRVLVNEESPWAWYSELAETEQDRWVIKNLHEPIQRALSRGHKRVTKPRND